jgi:transposase-like protein
MNLYSLARKFPTEEHALAHLMKVRWPNGIRCIACDHDKCWLSESKGKTGKPRRLFQCAKCKIQFTATVGTIFHDSHLPLSKWFAAIALMAEAKKGISANQIARHVGMTYKTAWYVCHRIREAMRESESVKIGDDMATVEIDETYIGGKKRNMPVRVNRKNKIAVLGMAERHGIIHMESVPSPSLLYIKPIIDKRLGAQAFPVITDSAPVYDKAVPRDRHKKVDHSQELKSRNYTSNYTIESAFSLFKRGVVGNYHQLSLWHMNRYLGEFCWRFNRRGLQPWMFEMVLRNMVTRNPLPYKKLIEF